MDLHDHVGAQITYLISNLDRLGIQERDEESNIRGLGKYAREAMRELRDTVWAIRKDRMQLGEMMQRISTFANSMFQDTAATYQQEISANRQLVLEPGPALHLLRIIQEALHNIHKHAEAQHVTLRVSSKDTELRIVIKDDGKGFSEESVNQDDHNGLRNMRDRASEIGAVFRVKSATGEGTVIEIALPVKNKANAPLEGDQKKTSLVP